MIKNQTKDGIDISDRNMRSLLHRWYSIRGRCFNSNHPEYKNYGGRGITMCDEWKDFSVFLKWSLANGYSRELQIDRKDNDKSYSPDNCRFVDRIVNSNNTRKNVNITFNNKTLSLSAWSREIGIPKPTLYSRLYTHNWPIEKALSK